MARKQGFNAAGPDLFTPRDLKSRSSEELLDLFLNQQEELRKKTEELEGVKNGLKSRIRGMKHQMSPLWIGREKLPRSRVERQRRLDDLYYENDRLSGRKEVRVSLFLLVSIPTARAYTYPSSVGTDVRFEKGCKININHDYADIIFEYCRKAVKAEVNKNPQKLPDKLSRKERMLSKFTSFGYFEMWRGMQLPPHHFNGQRICQVSKKGSVEDFLRAQDRVFLAVYNYGRKKMKVSEWRVKFPSWNQQRERQMLENIVYQIKNNQLSRERKIGVLEQQDIAVQWGGHAHADIQLERPRLEDFERIDEKALRRYNRLDAKPASLEPEQKRGRKEPSNSTGNKKNGICANPPGTSNQSKEPENQHRKYIVRHAEKYQAKRQTTNGVPPAVSKKVMEFDNLIASYRQSQETKKEKNGTSTTTARAEKAGESALLYTNANCFREDKGKSLGETFSEQYERTAHYDVENDDEIKDETRTIIDRHLEEQQEMDEDREEQ